eukprot:TRINITY_DN3090_c0_g1_i1.p1 TRINITY_DN3090_c0_g1~~TRINITY_DN3090_c0_g1_i1.p1  ORF type:complete len:243 (+),score=34.23 TRINITY_DN3090_c0_g1_i1:75-803(+)
MGERKVVNKYHPPEFDPSIIPRSVHRRGLLKVNMMLPMSIRCITCGEYIYRGTKFNSKKETVDGEDYLGIPIYRFYYKCIGCSSTITFRTDPEHSDYAIEYGATRNFEEWRLREQADAEAQAQQESAEAGDLMKKLEHRAQANKSQMDATDRLDELRSLDQRRSMVTNEQLLQLSFADEALTAAEDELVRQFRINRKRSEDSDSCDDGPKRINLGTFGDDGLSSKAASVKPCLRSVVVVKKS